MSSLGSQTNTQHFLGGKGHQTKCLWTKWKRIGCLLRGQIVWSASFIKEWRRLDRWQCGAFHVHMVMILAGVQVLDRSGRFAGYKTGENMVVERDRDDSFSSWIRRRKGTPDGHLNHGHRIWEPSKYDLAPLCGSFEIFSHNDISLSSSSGLGAVQ